MVCVKKTLLYDKYLLLETAIGQVQQAWYFNVPNITMNLPNYEMV
jgi:hypothetical protein